MYIHIELSDDTDESEAIQAARKIIAVLDDADAIPDCLDEITIGGETEIWISDRRDQARNGASN